MEPAAEYDYVIVGSGAGGATVAARLAERGMRVFLLEAGGDPREAASGLPEQYDVPAFHPLVSENQAMSWEFFVRHYADDERQKADWKWQPDPDTGKPSIYYPRAGTLGGCTAHNAMIFVAPNESDWDYIADLTGDPTWRAEEMRKYFRRVEACRHRRIRRWYGRWVAKRRHRPLWRRLYDWIENCQNRPGLRRIYDWFGVNPPDHGWEGWLPAERALPLLRRIRDFQLFRVVMSTALMVVFDGSAWRSAVRRLTRGEADPNDVRRLRQRADGLCYTPLSTDWHSRKGTRERLREVENAYPENLRIERNAFATKILFDSEKRAIGVEYLEGDRLYRASPKPGTKTHESKTILAAREVILAGGAFNTPQLLMVSGIGPEEVLEKWDIPIVQALEGVGHNLQDRYEVAIVYRMRKPWSSLNRAEFKSGDYLYEDWQKHRKAWHGRGGGMYIANGAAIAFSMRSSPYKPDPDLFCMALLAPFRGYLRGYSKEVCNPDPNSHVCMTWAILKAYAGSRGSVTLRSADPLARPEINFRYFEETDEESAREDLEALVEGVKSVRRIASSLKSLGLIEAEEFPGEEKGFPGEGENAKERLKQHIRNTAWGHHASCTCPIGPREPTKDLPRGGVLSSDFKVYGTQGLRVVDASVFPRIPGFFIASAIYMIAEKAADVILQEAGHSAVHNEPNCRQARYHVARLQAASFKGLNRARSK